MKYAVDFEKEINSMFRNNIGVCRYFHKTSCGLLERFENTGCFSYCFRARNGISYLRNLLKNETAFENPLFGLLFKAFVYAEINFICKYIPQRSHEERLTDYLISELANSLSIINDAFKQKAIELYNSKISLDCHYADLSSNMYEENPGVGFGLIFHINLPKSPEKVNIAIIQSKNFDENEVRFDSSQYDILTRFSKGHGYHCFYDITGQYSPLIQKVKTRTSILNFMYNVKNTLPEYKLLQREDIINQGIPLSAFLILDMLNTECEIISSFTALEDAKDIINSLNRDLMINNIPRILRVLVVSISEIPNNRQKIRNLFIS